MGHRHRRVSTDAAPARPTASTASASTEEAGTSAGADGSRAYSSLVKSARTCSALAAKRRNQPLAVETRRPSAAAINR